jgi:lysophospholipase
MRNCFIPLVLLLLAPFNHSCRTRDMNDSQMHAMSSEWKITGEQQLPALLAEGGAIQTLWQDAGDEFISVNRHYGKSHETEKIRLNYRRFLHPDKARAIVISHGHPEYIGKYRELIYDFYQQGYSVYILSHRGYGRSDRLADDPVKTHTDDFMYYIYDMNVFVNEIVKPGGHSSLYLFAHSMGGAVGAIHLKEYPGVFQAAVLSSPMLEISTKPFPTLAARAVTGGGILVGKGTDYAPGQGAPTPEKYEQEASGTSSVIRLKSFVETLKAEDQDPSHPLDMGGATNHWVFSALRRTTMIRKQENASQVTDAVLLFSSKRDTFVVNGGQHVFCSYAKNCQLQEIDAKHELWLERDEIRTPYLIQVFKFFQSH